MGDPRDGMGCFSERNGGLHQTLPSKVAHVRVADQSIEPVREGRTRKADFAGQILRDEVASDSFSLEVPQGAMELKPSDVPDFDELPGMFAKKGAQ